MAVQCECKGQRDVNPEPDPTCCAGEVGQQHDRRFHPASGWISRMVGKISPKNFQRLALNPASIVGTRSQEAAVMLNRCTPTESGHFVVPLPGGRSPGKFYSSVAPGFFAGAFGFSPALNKTVFEMYILWNFIACSTIFLSGRQNK